MCFVIGVGLTVLFVLARKRCVRRCLHVWVFPKQVSLCACGLCGLEVGVSFLNVSLLSLVLWMYVYVSVVYMCVCGVHACGICVVCAVYV